MYIVLDLLDSLGGYQTSESWSDSRFDLTEVILKFLQINAAPLFDLTLDIDAKNRERYALIVELPRPTSLVPNLFRPPRQDDDLMNVCTRKQSFLSQIFILSNRSTAIPERKAKLRKKFQHKRIALVLALAIKM